MSTIDYTNTDYQGFKQLMIASLQELIPEYTDTSETDMGMVIFEILCKALDVITYYQNSQANECFLTTAEMRKNALKWCGILGYVPSSFTPAKYVQWFVVRPDAGELFLPKGTVIRTKDTSNAEYFTTLSDLKINTSSDLTAQKGYMGTTDDDNYIFTVDIAHGVLVTNETVGVADGETENLKFSLSGTPVVLPDYDEDGRALMPESNGLYPDGYDEARAFSVTVKTSDGEIEDWTLKSSFVDSGSSSRDFRAEVSQNNVTTIIFGDGVNGKIPQGEVIVSYRKGGGSIGNVGAKTINTLASPVYGIVETYNPDMAYSLGQDKESIKSIRLNAPNSFRTKWSCVQASDYADKVLELFPRVFMATSFSITENTDIDYGQVLFGTSGELTRAQENQIVDTVQICILLTGDILNDDGKYKKLKDFRRIEDAPELRQDILDSLESRAIIGTYRVLTSFTSKMVTLKSSLLVLSGYDYDEVKTNVENFLSEYFAIGNIKAGAIVALNEIEADVFAEVKGVRAFRITSFVVDGVENTTSLDITSNLWEIIELDDDGTFANIINPAQR